MTDVKGRKDFKNGVKAKGDHSQQSKKSHGNDSKPWKKNFKNNTSGGAEQKPQYGGNGDKPWRVEFSKTAENQQAAPSDSNAVPVAAKKANYTAMKTPNPLVKHIEGAMWYDSQVDAKAYAQDAETDRVSFAQQQLLFSEALKLLRTDEELYGKLSRSQGGSEASWLQSVIQSGTASDKLTAMQLQIKKSPVHSLTCLREMVKIVEGKHARQVLDILSIVEKNFIQDLLPPNRKLVPFDKRPLHRLNELSSGSDQGRKRILVLWMFEHELKEVYKLIIAGLGSLCGGTIENLCMRILRTCSELLAERPEGEKELLEMLANKLGHPNYKVGSRVAHHLEVLARRQPNMREVIVSEVERVIYRKNVNDRAHVYSSTFLSTIALRHGDADLAVHLLTIYFGLFKTLIARREMDHKLLKILLSGANRAFPIAKEKAEALFSEIDTLYKLVHTSTFAVAIQTLKLLLQVLNLHDSVTDRYYQALYRKLFNFIPPKLYNQLLLLLYKTMKADPMESRVRTLVKRLLQLAVSETPPFAAGILILISKLREERPNLIVTKKTAEISGGIVGNDDEEEVYVDLDDDGKPLERVKIESLLEEKKEKDVVKTTEDEKKKNLKGRVAPMKTQGWVHKNNLRHHSNASLYDPNSRNPLFIDCSGLVDAELQLLSHHYHPSIVLFANSLIRGDAILYNGDPLEDFSTIKFLDRFAYKNPKKFNSDDPKTAYKGYVPVGARRLAVMSKEYLTKKPEEIPADERYLHKFASMKFKPKAEEKAPPEWDDAESVNSDEFEVLLKKFEPGEKNEEFEIDFAKEFSAEKNRKNKGKKRKADDEDGSEGGGENEDGEDDEMLDEEDWDDEDGMDEEDGDGEGKEENDDDDWDDDVDGSDEDEEGGGGLFGKGKGSDSDSDDDMVHGDADAFISADSFASMLEDAGEDKKKLKKSVKKPFNNKKKGGKRR